MRTFFHLGTVIPDYRSIMREHGDFQIAGKTIPATRVVIAEQTHSDLVHVCTESDCGAGFGVHSQIAICDALITNIPQQYLLIRTADCTPVIISDKQGRAVGAVHSGREGTRKNIVGKTVLAFQEHYGIPASDIQAYIGAGICHRHYQVDEKTWQEFNTSILELGIVLDTTLDRHIDIQQIIYKQLLKAGVASDNIEQNQICTYESADHFSYRRDGTHNRQINLIGMEYE